MTHRERIEAVKVKHTPPEFDDELMELIEQAVKDKSDNRDKQGDIDGRETEN